VIGSLIFAVDEDKASPTLASLRFVRTAYKEPIGFNGQIAFSRGRDDVVCAGVRESARSKIRIAGGSAWTMCIAAS
jgi:hypothetical protein